MFPSLRLVLYVVLEFIHQYVHSPFETIDVFTTRLSEERLATASSLDFLSGFTNQLGSVHAACDEVIGQSHCDGRFAHVLCRTDEHERRRNRVADLEGDGFDDVRFEITFEDN